MQPPIDFPENVIGLTSSMRRWSGVTVIHSEFTCSGRVMYEVPYDNESRLGLILEEVGEYKSEPRLAREAPCRVDYKPQQVNFVPAGMTVWGYSGDIRHARDVRLCFDAAMLREACQLEKVDAHADVLVEVARAVIPPREVAGLRMEASHDIDHSPLAQARQPLAFIG